MSALVEQAVGFTRIVGAQCSSFSSKPAHTIFQGRQLNRRFRAYSPERDPETDREELASELTAIVAHLNFIKAATLKFRPAPAGWLRYGSYIR